MVERWLTQAGGARHGFPNGEQSVAEQGTPFRKVTWGFSCSLFVEVTDNQASTLRTGTEMLVIPSVMNDWMLKKLKNIEIGATVTYKTTNVLKLRRQATPPTKDASHNGVTVKTAPRINEGSCMAYVSVKGVARRRPTPTTHIPSSAAHTLSIRWRLPLKGMRRGAAACDGKNSHCKYGILWLKNGADTYIRKRTPQGKNGLPINIKKSAV